MKRRIWKIPLIYAIIGILWILLSDRVAGILFDGSRIQSFSYFQTVKGIFFVLTTAVILYFLMRWFYTQLISSAEEYRKLYELHPNPMWVYDPSTLKFLSVNKAAIESYGYSESEFLSMTIADIRPRDEIPALLENIQQDTRDYQLSDLWKHKKKSGQEFYVNIFSSKVYHNGEPARLVTAIDVDQTQKTRLQKELMNARLIETGNYLKSLIDSHSSFLIRFNLQGDLTFANKQFSKDLGYQSEAIQKANYTEIFHNEDWRGFQKALITCRQNPGEVHSITLRSLSKDQNVIFSEWEFVGIEGIDGQTNEVQGVGRDVTQRVKSIQELQNYKNYFSRILSSLNDVVVSMRIEDYSYIFVNETCKEVTGYTSEEFMESPDLWQKMLSDEELKTVQMNLEEAKTSGKEVIFECQIKTKGGKMKDIQCRVKRHFNEKESRYELHSVYTDITGIKKAQTKARQYAQQVKEILESITEGFFTVDKDLNFDYLNKGFELHTGYKKEEWLGRNLWEAFPGDNQHSFYSNFTMVMQKDKKKSFEEYHPVFDKWLRIAAYPKNDGLSVYFEDITASKNAREQIRQSRNLLESIINNTTDMVWAVDYDLKLLAANDSFIEQTEKILQIGDSVLTRLESDKKDYQRWKDLYLRALAGETFTHEERSDSSGEVKHYEISFSPLRDQSDKTIGVNCFGHDTTHHKNLELMLTEQNERLREIAHLQSHVVRNPVANIQGLLKLLDKTELTAPNNAEILKHMET